MRCPRRPCVCIIMAAALLAALLFRLDPPAHAQGRTRSGSCRESLWGCAGSTDGDSSESAEPRRVRYARHIATARRLIASLRSMPSAAAADQAKEARQRIQEALQIFPDEPDAHSLLGQLEQERGQLLQAGLALRHAEDLYAHAAISDAMALSARPPLEIIDPPLAMALALLQAQEGDLVGALARYQRLFDQASHSPRLLYRMADVLMLLGRLEDATALYQLACSMPKGIDAPIADTSRACLGYAVALDRGEHAIPPAIWRKARIPDRGPRPADLADFPSAWERDYHRALVLTMGCERRASLLRYLRSAATQAPVSYRRRAELHLARVRDLSCPPPPDPLPAAPRSAPPSPASGEPRP